MVIVLDFRAFHYFKADIGEQPGNPPQGERHRMQTAAALAPSGQADVEGFAGETRLQSLLFQTKLALFQGGLEAVTD